MTEKTSFQTNERQLIGRLVLEYPIFHEAYEGFNDQCMYCGMHPEYISNCKTDPRWPGSSHYHTKHRKTCAWIEGMEYLEHDIGHEHERLVEP